MMTLRLFPAGLNPFQPPLPGILPKSRWAVVQEGKEAIPLKEGNKRDDAEPS